MGRQNAKTIHERRFAAVLDQLWQADMRIGISLRMALYNVLEREPTRQEKDKIRISLLNYASDNPEGIFYWYNGQQIYPGLHQEKSEGSKPGHSEKWKLVELPKRLTDDLKALILELTRRYSQFLLQPGERRVVEGLCREKAPQRLESAQWLKQVEVVPRYPPLYPEYDENRYQITEEVVLRALIKRQGFHAYYLRPLDEAMTVYFPVKLVRREWVSYVVCCQNTSTPEYREYAIHRFQIGIAKHADDVQLVPVPIGLMLDYGSPHVTGGVPGPWCTLKKMVIQVSGPPAQHLSEMRFHASKLSAHLTCVLDREINEAGRVGSATIEIRDLPYTYEFKMWLLGLGRFVRVLCAEPESPISGPSVIEDLREEIAQMFQKSLQLPSPQLQIDSNSL